jgi:hypothetical protein
VTLTGGIPLARAVIVAGEGDPGVADTPPAGAYVNLALVLDATGSASAALALPRATGRSVVARAFVADGTGWAVSPRLVFATFGPPVDDPGEAPERPRRCASRLRCDPP